MNKACSNLKIAVGAWLVSIFLMPCFALAQDVTLPSGERLLSLEGCVTEAMQRNPKILAAQQDLERSFGALISTKSVIYPSVTGNAQVKWENDDLLKQSSTAARGFNDDWTVGISISKRIFSGGADRKKVEAAELTKDVARIALEETMNDVISETRKVFYEVLASQSEIEVRKQQVDLLTQEVKRQRSLFEAGQATRFNIVRTEVRLANELPGLESAENKLRISLMNLRELMGLSANENFRIDGKLDCPPFAGEANDLVKKAIARSPELTRMDKQIAIAKKNEEIAKAWFIPRLDLFATTEERQDDSKSGFFSNRNQSTFGILGTWNIFDGYASDGAAKQASADKKKNQILRDAALRRIENDVRKALLNLRQAEASLKTQEQNVKLAYDSIRLARSSAEAGFATQFDVLQATVDLSSTQNIELQARYNYHVALADLEHAMYTRIRSLDQPMDSIPVSSLEVDKPKSRIPSGLKLREGSGG